MPMLRNKRYERLANQEGGQSLHGEIKCSRGISSWPFDIYLTGGEEKEGYKVE